MVLDTAKDYELLGLAGFLLFLAAALWVEFTKPSRTLGLFLLVISVSLFAVAFNTALGNVTLPSTCSSGKAAIICVLENFLYLAGGYFLASTLWFLFAFGVLYGSIITFKNQQPNPSFKRDA